MNRFNFRIANTKGFWSLVKLFEGIQDTMAFDKLVHSCSEHEGDITEKN